MPVNVATKLPFEGQVDLELYTGYILSFKRARGRRSVWINNGKPLEIPEGGSLVKAVGELLAKIPPFDSGPWDVSFYAGMLAGMMLYKRLHG